MRSDLIKIEEGIIGNAVIRTVNARELHEFLEVKTEFKNWIVRRVREYGFAEDSDFRSFLTESFGGRLPSWLRR